MAHEPLGLETFLLLDYHVHTSLCGHAQGSMDQYVERAVDLGLEEIGFSGHFPYPDGFDPPVPDCVIPAELFGEYLERARSLRSLYEDRIKITIGAEFDYLGPEYPVRPLESARDLELDFCMGSVHMVDRVVVDYSPDFLRHRLEVLGGIDRLYELYYKALLNVASPGFCTTLGHLDLVKKFKTFDGLAPSADHSALVEEILKALAGSGIVMELNTSGWDKPCNEQYPSLQILERAVSLGVRITTGSDAHRPEEVGRHFDKLKTLLKKAGVKELVRFEKLEAYPYPL